MSAVPQKPYVSAFESTLHRLNSAFSVWDIATVDPVTINSETIVDDFLKENGAQEFDYYPVSSETGDVIGLLEIQDSDRSLRAYELMKNLENSILVSSGAPLISALKKLDTTGVLLVLHETKIAGILTKADAQKLPVRLYAFTLITHLESLMASINIEKIPKIR
jgi:predicted transcriptional regulator